MGFQAHQVEAPVQPFAMQDEGEGSPFRMPWSASLTGSQVPRSQVSTLLGTVLAVRDGALEVGVVDRVVFDMGGDVLDGGIERRPLAHRPAPQHAVVLQAEVIVQAGAMRLVLLHHEHRFAIARAGVARGEAPASS